MKKVALFLLVIGTLILSGVKTNAATSEFTESLFYTRIEEMNNSSGIEFDMKFNVIQGISSEEFLMAYQPFFLASEDWQRTFINGTVYISTDIVGNNTSARLVMSYTYEQETLKLITAKVDEELIYEVYTDGCENARITVCKPFNLFEYLGETYEYYSLSKEYKVECSEDCEFNLDRYGDYLVFDGETAMTEYGFRMIYGFIYKLNDVYEGKEVHFVTSVSNPITEQEILSTIRTWDFTEDYVDDVYITESEYLITDGKIAVGEYKFIICAYDRAMNLTIQPCTINVIDIDPPVVTPKENLSRSFSDSQISVHDMFVIEDESKYSLEILENDYTPNRKKPGNYKVKVRVYDIYGNETISTASIKIYDLGRPIITVKNNICFPVTEFLTESTLREYIEVFDYCDGYITDYTIRANDLFETKKSPGSYPFDIYAFDFAGNNSILTAYVTFVDRDYPDIYVDEFTIFLSEGEELTREKAIEILKSIGQISSEVIAVETNFSFSTDAASNMNTVGTYNLVITDVDGNTFYNKIEVVQNSTIDFTPIEDVPSKNNTVLYTVIAIVCVVLIISVMGGVIYKKRH